MLGHFANQAAILGKWAAWAGQAKPKSDFERKGEAAQSILVISLLAAKLNEGWEMLQQQYFGSGLSRIYAPKLAQEAQDALKDLGRYFGTENVIRACRDQYAFHYDGNALREHYKTLPAGEDMDFFLCNFAGCNLFNVAESAAAHALLENIEKAIVSKAFKH